MKGLLEDGLGLVDVKLGLEVAELVGIAGAVGSAARVGECEVLVDNLFTSRAPVDEESDSIPG